MTCEFQMTEKRQEFEHGIYRCGKDYLNASDSNKTVGGIGQKPPQYLAGISSGKATRLPVPGTRRKEKSIP